MLLGECAAHFASDAGCDRSIFLQDYGCLWGDGPSKDEDIWLELLKANRRAIIIAEDSHRKWHAPAND
jgi:hypothetical protein